MSVLHASCMEPVGELAAKLGIAMRAVSLSRVGLAQILGVDKSLIGRWLAGTVHPSEHNLVRLSEVLADRMPGFRLADWYADRGEFAHGLGVVDTSVPPIRSVLPAPLAAFLDAAGTEFLHRTSAYEGFWRTARPSLLVPDRIFHDYGMIRRSADGMAEVRMAGSGLEFDGWMFSMGGNVHSFLYDHTGRTPMALVFKGVSLPRAVVLDGILLLAALDPDRTPVALPIVLERVGDLSGDHARDDERYAAILEEKAAPLEPVPEDLLRARLYRSTGKDSDKGGDPFLMVSPLGNLSKGAGLDGLSG